MSVPHPPVPGADVPSQPGWYADADGAWWWWDGGTWTPAPAPAPTVLPDPATAQQRERSAERTTALIMWVVFVVGGGWLAALVFYLVSKEKAFVRHHAAEALNLTLVLLIPQVAGLAMLAPSYVALFRDSLDEPGGGVGFEPTATFWLGLVLMLVTALASYAVAITGAVMANRGRWWRVPLPFHPVRGAVRAGEEPYAVTDG